MVTSTTLVLILILIVGFIFLSAPLKCAGIAPEAFSSSYDHYGFYKRYCPSCSWRSKSSCSNCTNCGYCITPSGFGECVPGDSNGPYFKDNCMYWNYGDSNYSYTNLSSVYPVIKTNSLRRPKFNLRKPRRWKQWRNSY